MDQVKDLEICDLSCAQDSLFDSKQTYAYSKPSKRQSSSKEIVCDATLPELMSITRNWIEESTGLLDKDKTFIEYLSDGTVLCRLIQTVRPGLIKRTNRIKSPFAWRENILFFLEACRALGVKEVQLFKPEDLCDDSFIASYSRKSSSNQFSQENTVRKVCEAIYFLGHKVADLPEYRGPKLGVLSLETVLQTPLKVQGNSKVYASQSQSLEVTSRVSPTPSSKVQEYIGETFPPRPVRKVQSIVNLITESSTCANKQQSFAEVVPNLDGESVIYHSDQLIFPVKDSSSLDFCEPASSFRYKGIIRTASCGTTHLPQPEVCKTSSLQYLNTHSSSPRSNSSPVSNSSTLVSPSNQRRLEFTSALSQASTAISQHTTPSPSSDTECEENDQQVPVLNTDATWNNPTDHTNKKDSCSSFSQLSQAQSHVEEAIFLSNPFSPHHLSNPSVLEIDHTGILNNHLNSVHKSPGREIAYHFSLTQKSEDPSPRVSVDYSYLKNPTRLKSFDSDSSLRDLSILSPEHKLVVSEPIISPSELNFTDKPSQLTEVNSSFHTAEANKSNIDCFTDIHPSENIFSTNSPNTSMSLVDSPNEGQMTNDSCCTEPADIPDPKAGGRYGFQSDVNKVPHHNLMLPTSGPDSPSSYKVSHTQHSEQHRPPNFIVCEVNIILLPGENRLGLNLVEDTSNGVTLRVKAIGERSAAARSNLQLGNELLAVNDISLLNIGLNSALHIIQESLSSGRLTFQVLQAVDVPNDVIPTHYKYLRPPDLLDMSKVNSEYSQKPRTVQLASEWSESVIPDSLGSSTVDITSCADDMNAATEYFQAQNGDIDESIAVLTDPVIGESAENSKTAGVINDDGQSTAPHSKNSKILRPLSAPTKSLSSSNLVSNKSHTLPSRKSASDTKSMQEKQAMLDQERKRRSSNIHTNAQVLLKYSQERRYSQTGSLPRDYQSLTKFFYASDEAESNTAVGRQSLHDSTCSPSSSASVSTGQDDDSSLSTPLNLRHISIDETRLASLIHMDKIWRQVESGDDSPNASEKIDHATNIFSPLLAHDLSHGTDYSDDGEVNGESSSPELNGDHSGDTVSTQNIITETDIILSVSDAQSTGNPNCEKPDLLMTQQESKERPVLINSKGIESLLSTLKALGAPDEDGDDLRVLEDMLKSNTFQKARKVHDKMHQLLSTNQSDLIPPVRRIIPSTLELRQQLHRTPVHSEEMEELKYLLRLPHLQALIFCYDKVSTHDLYVPSTYFHDNSQDSVDIILNESVYQFQTSSESIDSVMPLSRDIPSSRKEGAVIVFVERSNKPLGITIYDQENSVFIGKLQKGCDAEASDVIREGDELLEVNGSSVWNKSIDNVINLLSPENYLEGETLVLTIIPVHDDNVDLDYETKYLRAHFNYNGKLDEEIPCKALGLSFRKGDIMEISNQEDPLWWQARKIFDDGAESLPGLVPSRHLQQQREAVVRSYPFSVKSKKKGFGSLFLKKKKKKVFYHSTSTSSSVGVGDEVPTYEEVVRLNPNQCPNRPIILIGAPRVGKRALILELISSDLSRFSNVIPHTCRNPKPGEVDGQDYFFVTKEEFESDIHHDRFLEYGEYKGSYYGTSFTSIKKIMESSKVPVLDVHPQALKKLRYSELQPYVVFIASPRVERLQLSRKTESDKKFGHSSRSLSEEQHIYTEHDLQRIVEESRLIENQYGHYFDWIIVNDDFKVASDMLQEVVRRVQEEPQWISALWKFDKL